MSPENVSNKNLFCPLLEQFAYFVGETAAERFWYLLECTVFLVYSYAFSSVTDVLYPTSLKTSNNEFSF